MALFHLLQNQNDVLLLLDEPETHFNDKWKREIVDIIDDAIANTANDVLISTHSAIVLSDVFNDEIVMIEARESGSTAIDVPQKTFGGDPGELMIRVFGASDSTGKRAQTFIEETIRNATGSQQDIARVRALVARMGPGFYRSELQTLLNKWAART
jgi:energy-coupling factor transporter ATP-binding protein EcfA2